MKTSPLTVKQVKHLKLKVTHQMSENMFKEWTFQFEVLEVSYSKLFTPGSLDQWMDHWVALELCAADLAQPGKIVLPKTWKSQKKFDMN